MRHGGRCDAWTRGSGPKVPRAKSNAAITYSGDVRSHSREDGVLALVTISPRRPCYFSAGFVTVRAASKSSGRSNALTSICQVNMPT